MPLRRESPIRGRRLRLDEALMERALMSPAGYWFLLAHPECAVEFMAPPAQYRAELLTGDARASAWARVTDFYAGYERYRASCAPREIRLFRLRPIAA
ncbi:MAG TPA: nitroreductase/quinone reductase family protein [Mycobacterium sp.]|uniref:nitroreductase/quinone reductase family protein n=1 Tax=Mycobacterium sp. TaxID=1785 RepID=UPI002D232CA2|nr:nitroreductase/quinone reductase family protein [Mycobacterium sp.]HXY65573.1 nitroreductase/quinone reductase family protein [Mycobacterium sp.]